MNNIKMYCITVNNDHLRKIESLSYLPVGLGENIKSKNFLRDNFGKHISHKNSFYGEYTFHYWLWKNAMQSQKENEWIGFCQYRKFWMKDKKKITPNTFEELNKNVLKKINTDFENYESVLGENLFINQLRLSKFIKKNPVMMIKNPLLFFDKSKRNIKFHFDMFHGEGTLDKAIKKLEPEDRSDFKYFVNSEVSFNPHNMFICKSSKILKKYYESVFPWLERCEKIFGFDLDGYALKRIYGFLAERYMSFWFKKNTKFTTLPITVSDISSLN